MTEIYNDIPIPTEVNKVEKINKRARASNKKKKDNPALKLLDALKFVGQIQRKAGLIGEQFCSIHGKWVCAFDGMITIGTQIEEELSLCPQTTQLITALSEVDGDLSITELAGGLAITSGTFRGYVSCVPTDQVFIPPPDAPCAQINDTLKQSLHDASIFVSETGQNIIHCAMLLQRDTVVGTNGHAIVESYHGIDLPPVLIPKAFALLIAKCQKELVSFGFSQSSVTFWCKDGSFIRTQLYNDRYPQYKQLFKEELSYWKVPVKFFNAVKLIQQFNEDGIVYITDGAIASNTLEGEASTQKIDLPIRNAAFNAKYITACEKCMDKVSYEEETKKLYFIGATSRGIILGLDAKPERLPNQVVSERKPYTNDSAFDEMDDDIPF